MNIKQKLFVDEYLVDMNATQAAIRAGYSKKTARSIGNENLTKPYIKEYIDKKIEEKEEHLEERRTEIVNNLTEMMRNNTASEGDKLKAMELLGERLLLFEGEI